ncbi:ATP-binding protein [Paucibacter sp. R3-3]|uniref:histidine kinase n=1 Tax=Roseateles agri TaxID=3098619 RepID=A0ABU5DMC5_9BURK|nr:ATP-binding protein [Paucibacter sp. R3-3]MDY0747457.1 ATP-binding protein [Paucibacter sp. R3-3]
MSLARWAQAPSLRRRLMLLLIGAICLAGLLQGISAYRTALEEADQIFDYQMQQMALSLTGDQGRQVVMPRELELIIQAWTSEGIQLFHSGTPLPQRAVLGFTNVRANGTEYRVLSVQSGREVLQVAQDLAVRQRLASRLAWRTVTPIALMLPVLMLVIGWVVSRSLAPVERVRRQLSRRAAADLAPVGEDDLPAEIRPMVHELNSLLGRVQQSFELQRNFVADAAHELRSPLTALKLQVQALQRAADEPTRALVQGRLAAGIERATHLVEQLLLLARQEAALTEPQALDLQALVRQVMGEQAATAQAREIDIGLVHADELQVRGRADALRVLVRNLLDNAIKYTPSGGRVDVSLRAEGGAARLVVEDSGPGIREDERARVFDRFYRSASTQGTAVTGSGLGLAIVKSIADRHGATLTLDRSQTLGGLRVDVRLPLA